MCNKRKKDYRPFKERFWDCYYNKPWKMVLYTFLASLVLFFVSWLMRNRGVVVVFTYPISLPFYALTVVTKKKQLDFTHAGMGPPFVLFHWLLPIFAFILGLLGVEL